MKTPLTNMEGRWVHSTKEAFDALVEMGYDPITDNYTEGANCLEVIRHIEGTVIYQVGFAYERSVQAYYHNGHFYDQPYEEFTITDDKVQFPELEDIEWIMVIPPEFIHHYLLVIYDNETFSVSCNTKIKPTHKRWLESVGVIYENSKDFKVTWKLKEKINRKLHENRPLALAIGRWFVEATPKNWNEISGGNVVVKEGYILTSVIFGNIFIGGTSPDDNTCNSYDLATLPDDYIIPDQVLQWMKEYDHTN